MILRDLARPSVHPKGVPLPYGIRTLFLLWSQLCNMAIRDFSTAQGLGPKERTIDSEAPLGLRNELVGLVRLLAGQTGLSDDYFPRLMASLIGVQMAGNPSAGPWHAIGRDLAQAEWTRVYDLLTPIALEFWRHGLFDEFQADLNRILAGYRIAWDLGEGGKLFRVLPPEASALVRVAMDELARPQFDAARRLLNDAIDAYNDRPRRPRDACANAFDAAESAAKVIAGTASGTMNDALDEMRTSKALKPESLALLTKLNVLRHNHFGHGTVAPFALSDHEVDFVYLSCIGAVILFARMPAPAPTT